MDGPSEGVRDVVVRGLRVRCVELGEGPRLVVFVGDPLVGRAAILPAARAIARSARVLVPDLPGFGGSERLDARAFRYDDEAFADVVASLAARLGDGRPFTALGEWHASTVALALAAREPGLVERLVLSAPRLGAGPRALGERVARVPLLGSVLWKQVAGRSLLRKLVLDGPYADAPPAPAELDDLLAAFDAPAARAALHALLARRDDDGVAIARLPRLEQPTLVVCARDADAGALDEARRVARDLPRGQLSVLPCRGAPSVARPEELARAVLAHVAPPPKRPAPRTKRRGAAPGSAKAR